MKDLIFITLGVLLFGTLISEGSKFLAPYLGIDAFLLNLFVSLSLILLLVLTIVRRMMKR